MQARDEKIPRADAPGDLPEGRALICQKRG